MQNAWKWLIMLLRECINDISKGYYCMCVNMWVLIPTDKCIHKWYQQFQETESVLKGHSPGRPSTSQDDTERIRVLFQRSPKHLRDLGQWELICPNGACLRQPQGHVVQHHFGLNCWTLLFYKSTITTVVSLDMLENFVFPQIVAEADGLIFQQIVCTPLDKRFPGQWIGRGRPVKWPHGVLTKHPRVFPICAGGLQRLLLLCLWICCLKCGVK
jgi:hypothetical protein